MKMMFGCMAEGSFGLERKIAVSGQGFSYEIHEIKKTKSEWERNGEDATTLHQFRGYSKHM